MKTGTIIYFDEIEGCIDTFTSRLIRPQRASLLVESFKDGIATVIPEKETEMHSFSRTISNCFSEHCNFKQKLFETFNSSKDAKLEAIKFTFNNISFLVTNENAKSRNIYCDWLEQK